MEPAVWRATSSMDELPAVGCEYSPQSGYSQVYLILRAYLRQR